MQLAHSLVIKDSNANKVNLHKKKFSPRSETLDKQLTKAVDPLYASGEKKYKEALALVEKLSPEDAEKFWKAQERNKVKKIYALCM